MNRDILTTQRLDLLPDINDLKKVCKSIAVLDIIYDGQFCLNNDYYSNDNYMLFEFVDFPDAFFKVFFNTHGSVITGHSDNSSMHPMYQKPRELWKGLVDTLPKEFSEILKIRNSYEKEINYITFCVWKKYSDSKWQIGDIKFPTFEEDFPNGSNDDAIEPNNYIPDCSNEQFYILDGKPESYLEFDFNCSSGLKINNIKEIYDWVPLETIIKHSSDDLLRSSIKKLHRTKLAEIVRTGYPVFNI